MGNQKVEAMDSIKGEYITDRRIQMKWIENLKEQSPWEKVLSISFRVVSIIALIVGLYNTLTSRSNEVFEIGISIALVLRGSRDLVFRNVKSSAMIDFVIAIAFIFIAFHR